MATVGLEGLTTLVVTVSEGVLNFDLRPLLIERVEGSTLLVGVANGSVLGGVGLEGTCVVFLCCRAVMMLVLAFSLFCLSFNGREGLDSLFLFISLEGEGLTVSTFDLLGEGASSEGTLVAVVGGACLPAVMDFPAGCLSLK